MLTAQIIFCFKINVSLFTILCKKIIFLNKTVILNRFYYELNSQLIEIIDNRTIMKMSGISNCQCILIGIIQ